MATYTVYSRPGEELDRAVFVKLGFSWPAYLFTFAWSLWHRQWLVAAIMFASLVTIGTVVGAAAGTGLLLIVMLTAGCWGSDLRRRTLSAAGYRENQIVHGQSLAEAELRYFASVGKTEIPVPLATTKSNPTDHEPLGLFGTA